MDNRFEITGFMWLTQFNITSIFSTLAEENRIAIVKVFITASAYKNEKKFKVGYIIVQEQKVE